MQVILMETSISKGGFSSEETTRLMCVTLKARFFLNGCAGMYGTLIF